MELAFPRDGRETTFACVTKRLKDANALLNGILHENPLLDTRVYELEYADGHKASMENNAIAMNIFVKYDVESNNHSLFEKNYYHCTCIYHPAVVSRRRRMPFLAVINASCCLISLPSVR